MKISIYNSQKDVKISRQSIKEAVSAALNFHNVCCDEISLHFISDRKMRKMHADYFNDPSPTDCISFPYDKDRSSGYFFIGELFICPSAAIQYVDVNEGELYNEITLYIIHGILHLLGFDDIEPKDRRIMRKKEKELMDYLTHSQKTLTA